MVARTTFPEKCFSLFCNKNIEKMAAISKEGLSPGEMQKFYAGEWDKYWERFGTPAPDFDGKIVVDYGCGFGYDSLYALKNGAKHVYCLEISENRLNSSRELHRSHGFENATYIDNTDTKNLVNKIPIDSVDIIFSRDVMEHVPSPMDVLNSMYSIAKPGGAVYIGFSPFYKSPYGPHFRSKCKVPWIHLVFSEETILNVFKRLYALPETVKTYQDIEGWGVNKLSYYDYEDMIGKFPWVRTIEHTNRFPKNPMTKTILDILVKLIPVKTVNEIFIVNSYIKFEKPFK